MSDNTNQTSRQYLAAMTPQALGALGLNQVAFIKPVQEEGAEHYVVHAADGMAVRLFPTRELAELAIRQSDLQAVSLH
ncbi:DUF1150 family protein [Thalassobaculum sp.]|jgi:hypothetical protein|uniref:DUF1150 family protein n=1 Tax=Thalassobaculum sp. TaxID=2022740 RepID=UPI003B59DABD